MSETRCAVGLGASHPRPRRAPVHRLRDHYGLTQIVVDPSRLPSRRRDGARRMGDPHRRRGEGEDGGRPSTRSCRRRGRGLRTRDRGAGSGEGTAAAGLRRARVSEDVRLRYRFSTCVARRSTATSCDARRWWPRCAAAWNEIGFNEFQTPILTASSPEGGARLLVPHRASTTACFTRCRRHPAVQQLLMMSGFDRYFQIAPASRRGSARRSLLRRVLPARPRDELRRAGGYLPDDGAGDPGHLRGFADGKPVSQTFRRIPYADSIRRYGSDKPDLRKPIEMQR